VAGRLSALATTPTIRRVNAPLAMRALALAGAGAALAGPWTSGARAADPAVLSASPWPLWALAALALAAALLVWRLIAGRTAARAEAAALGRTLAARDAAFMQGPAGYLAWCGNAPEPNPSPGLAARLGAAADADATAIMAALRRHLSASDAAALDDGIAMLRAAGAPFGMTAGAHGPPRTYRFEGARTGDTDRLWIIDVTAAAGASGRLANATVDPGAGRDRLHALLDLLPLPVWQRARDLSLLYCNRAYARAVDAPGPAAALFDDREIGAAFLQNGGRGLAERARRAGSPQSESHHVVIDGERRLLEFTESPIGGRGEVGGFAQDMTALERVQDELGRYIDAHAQVLETLRSGIAIFGPDRRLRFHNRAFAALWRLDADRLDGEPEYGEILEDLRARRRLPEVADFRAFKQSQLDQFRTVLVPQESFVYLPDDTVLRSVVAPHPLGGLILLFEDVTDRLALERSYNTLITVQRETIDALQEAIAVFGSDGRLKLSNPAFARLWQLPPELLADEPHAHELIDRARPLIEIEGQSWHESRAEMIGRIVGRAAAVGRRFRADGTVVDFVLAPLADGGMLYTASDVTDTYNVEQALIERNKALEEADKLKSEFLANVSYELRTPLNTIIGFAEILNNGYFGPVNERQGEYCSGILEASQRLLALINDILDLAMIEAGQIELDLGPVAVDAVAAGILNLARERARKQNLDIRLECPPEVGTIVADERRLRQVLFNLVSNAIRFTPPGGKITLAARRDPGEVTLTVTDTGTGIDEADQIRVFGAFQQGGAGEGRLSGAGLGLTLVKRFVEMHGGRVTLESRPGAGTRVACHLPDRADGAPTV